MQAELERAVEALERIADGLEETNRLLSVQLAYAADELSRRSGYTWKEVLNVTLGGAREIRRRCDAESRSPAPAP